MQLGADHWLLGARRVDSPNFGDRPTSDISLIVIHNISLPPGQFGGPYIEQLFLNQLKASDHPYFAEVYQLEVSSHLLIRRDGEVIQFVAFDKRAWHAGRSSYAGRDNCNDYSIGIELEGCDDLPYEPVQYTRLNEVLPTLWRAYPSTQGHVVGHSDIAPGRKTDPGPTFDWRALSQNC
ncbi:MAG: 1,6-anhydro-N-acetylmuramyl-L-alanine amidase AmpD [Moraxellaceae bacterium]|nr:1,6-anhydro-N-acetylmuramyl-L-alanine amidase AmpD [Moraxellaceae bacterium]MDZ4387945.1 1,6-anhydro-N-acetylmuramyl-L-alanine amidase AmpD [Moraxellaceae bacterium]